MSAAEWRTETLERKDGRRFSGLTQSETENEIRFVEVKRPPGKPWFLVVHSYPPGSIKRIDRLRGNDRQQLIGRISPLLEKKSHARIEAGRMEDVKVYEVLRSEGQAFRYVGNWFDLLSTADEETTRRCVVRIDLIFRAYAQVLPRQHHPREKLQIVLHGSMDEYRRDLHDRNLQIQNPAFYSIKENLILAGSDLTRYIERVAEIRGGNKKLRAKLDEMDAGFTARMRVLREDLQRNGFSKDDIVSEIQIRRAKWRVDERKAGFYWDRVREINAIERRNDQRFDEVTDEMFRRLYHEAFHAYLENYVFPNREHRVPRWLNEGLAQIFENSQLDGETLRIDAPGRELLGQLQRDLRNNQSLSLRELLIQNNQAYLRSRDHQAVSQRHYLYSWGWAYYLTFQRDLLGGDALQRYVSAEDQDSDPVKRFEKLVGASEENVERQWRDYILSLRADGQLRR